MHREVTGFTLVMCVVVVVETDSDVIVCALNSTPASPPALPSSCE